MMLDLEKVSVWRGEQEVFHDFTLKIKRGERLAVLGANGAGKSTLLEIMTGGLRCAYVPGSSARLFGERLWSLEDLRWRVGILMPEQVRLFHRHELAGDVVLSAFRAAIGITAHMDFTEEEKERTAEVIAQVGLDDLAGRLFCTLSSGGKRRFLLARALVHRPEALVLDEAMTALDLPSAWGLMHTVRALSNAGTGLVMVTHDAREIPPEVERVVLLKKGRVLADGPKKEVMSAKLLGECYGMDLQVSWQGGYCQVGPADA